MKHTPRKPGKINEDATNLAAVAAGIAAVIGSGVGIAGLMEYLKEKYPKAYKAMSELGAAAGDSRSRGVNKPDPDGMNESKGKIRLKTLSESLQEKGK